MWEVDILLDKPCFIVEVDHKVRQQHYYVFTQEFLVRTDEHNWDNPIETSIPLDAVCDKSLLFVVERILLEYIFCVNLLGLLLLVYVLQKVVVHVGEHALHLMVIQLLRPVDRSFQSVDVEHVLVLHFVSHVVQLQDGGHEWVDVVSGVEVLCGTSDFLVLGFEKVNFTVF